MDFIQDGDLSSLYFGYLWTSFPTFYTSRERGHFFSHFGTECEGCKSLNSFLWEAERGLKYINSGILLAHAWA